MLQIGQTEVNVDFQEVGGCELVLDPAWPKAIVAECRTTREREAGPA